MRLRGRVALCVLLLLRALAPAGGARYGFYRDMGERRGDTRRVFGGTAASLEAFPAACALLDRYWATRCSCALVARRWALTAAHCVTPRVAYVKYNAHRPAARVGDGDGDVAAVHYLYRHPGYRVVQEDRGRGPDVTVLHHDVGLVRTRTDMRPATPPRLDPLRAMTLYDPADLRNEEVLVFGFGRTETSPVGEQLFSVRLQLVPCERGAWFHCVCGVAGAGTAGWQGAVRGARGGGVCSGDSGGPVVYRGALVAVTSMGPLECALRDGEAGTSVFTALRRYAPLVNATIHDTEAEMRMDIISSAAVAPLHPCTALLPLLLVAAGLHSTLVAASLVE